MKMINAVATSVTTFALAITLAACGSKASTSETSASDGAAEEAAAAPAAEELGKFVIQINTEGMGEVSFTQNGESFGFGDSAFTHANAGDTITLETRPKYDEYQFVKWTKDGADFSTDEKIEVTVDGDAEYIAVYEFVEE